jgi:hypothetical protein
VQSATLLNRIDFQDFGCFLALTMNDEQNTLGCLQFRRILGKERVAQVSLGNEDEDLDTRASISLRSQPLFGGVKLSDLLHLSDHGAVKLTALTKEFTFSDFMDHYVGRALPFLALHARRPPRILSKSAPPEPGEEVLSLIWAPEQRQSEAA